MGKQKRALQREIKKLRTALFTNDNEDLPLTPLTPGQEVFGEMLLEARFKNKNKIPQTWNIALHHHWAHMNMSDRVDNVLKSYFQIEAQEKHPESNFNWIREDVSNYFKDYITGKTKKVSKTLFKSKRVKITVFFNTRVVLMKKDGKEYMKTFQVNELIMFDNLKDIVKRKQNVDS